MKAARMSSMPAIHSRPHTQACLARWRWRWRGQRQLQSCMGAATKCPVFSTHQAKLSKSVHLSIVAKLRMMGSPTAVCQDSFGQERLHGRHAAASSEVDFGARAAPVPCSCYQRFLAICSLPGALGAAHGSAKRKRTIANKPLQHWRNLLDSLQGGLVDQFTQPSQ